MGEFLHSGPRVCYIWLIAKPCAVDTSAEIPPELWAGKTELLAGVTALGTLVHSYSSCNGTLSSYVGGKRESSQTRKHFLAWKALVITNTLHNNLKTSHILYCISFFIIAEDVLNCGNLTRVLLVCLRISNADFMKLQKTKAHLNLLVF